MSKKFMQNPGPGSEHPQRLQRLFTWLLLFIWLSYSLAALGWLAYTSPPGDLCVVPAGRHS